jgi:hypothetical protein
MSDDFKVFQNRSDMNVIFVHSELDDRNLSAPEFRVYCHLARRSGGGKAWPGIDSISRVCNLAKGTVIAAIRSLEAQNMVTAERTPGVPTRYILTPCSHWKPLPNLDLSKSGTVSNEVTERVKRGNATVSNEVTKGNPLKVIQKGNPKRQSPPAPVIPLLLQTPDFQEAWGRWNDHLRQKRKPATSHALDLQLKKLEGWGEKRAIAAINNSIMGNWQGIFEEKTNANGFQKPPLASRPTGGNL